MTKPPNTVSPFRIAFRTEGANVNCYLAENDTMEGAQLISFMPYSALKADATIFPDWQSCMQRVVAAACKGVLGDGPIGFDVKPAPEHERGGNA